VPVLMRLSRAKIPRGDWPRWRLVSGARASSSSFLLAQSSPPNESHSLASCRPRKAVASSPSCLEPAPANEATPRYVTSQPKP